jgi:hypothetical protein
MDHKSPQLPVGPDLPCVVDVYCELQKAIPMPNVIDGTDRLIRRKIKARFRKLTYSSKPGYTERCVSSYTPPYLFEPSV